ncbi:hypothetical protein HK101_009970 [Irineochytrium annulatum]|nr:hypothetical protein HK101_009970 [Irineochytrium annulatum]
MDLSILHANKELSRQPGYGQRSFESVLAELKHDCEVVLAAAETTLYSVMAKNETAISGDKHDYFSLARYYWPDPNSPNGLPYKRHDGEVNPEVFQVTDHTIFHTLTDSVQALSLGYFFLDDFRYANETARIIRQWFLDPDTAMNPHLNYSSVVKGLNGGFGRNTGVLDFQYIYMVFDALGLIYDSGAWTETDQAGLKLWFTNYLDWVWHGILGLMERDMPNNHGTWYMAQVSTIALYLNRTDIGAWTAQNVTWQIAHQIDMAHGGAMPYEVVRESSWYYSAFMLRAYFVNHYIMRNYGFDLLTYQGPANQSVSAALDFLIPHFLNNGTNWPYPKTYGFDSHDLVPVLKEAVANGLQPSKPGAMDYATALAQVQTHPETHNRNRLWAPAGAFDSPVFKAGAGMVRGHVAGLCWGVFGTVLALWTIA